jgi:orotidine-5'-phosphate decarboxylase
MKEDFKKIIVALDLPREKEIKKVVGALYPYITKFKVGLITYTSCGPDMVKWIKKQGADVFLDLKFFDIPNTMNEAAKNIVDQDVWAFTVHCKAGGESLLSLKDTVFNYAQKRGVTPPLLVGVTELTSKKASLSQVMRLARVAHKSDLEAIVCSVWEARKVKEEFDLITITPGIRTACTDDQKRVATFADVLREGADYCVVGRPIVKAKDYLKAVKELIAHR